MNRLRACWWLAGVLWLSACGSPANMTTWQEEVRHYVLERGRGDPNSLRDLQSPGDRHTIAVNGAEDPAHSTDVIGLLLGDVRMGDKPEMVFLVATVARNNVKDLRLAALSGSGADLVWRIGEPDPKALAAYERRHPPGGHPAWPARDDWYELSVGPDGVTAKERTSGASWTLPSSTASSTPRSVRQRPR